MSAGYVAIALRSSTPGNFSYVLPVVFSNAFTFMGVVLTFMAVEKLLGGKDRSIPLVILVSMVFGGTIAWMLSSGLKSSIGLIVGLVFGLVHIYFGYRIWTLSNAPNVYVRVMIIISLAHGVLWLFRGMLGFFTGFHMISSQVMTNVVFVLIFVMLYTARQFIYVLMRLAATSEERKQLVELNDEKNKLIGSLLRVNKTVATGALSASVVHEVNQPLGSIKLTLQYLRLKIGKNGIDNQDLIKELNWLESEVDRAVDTVKTLRSAFQEGDANIEPCDLVSLVEFVLNLSAYDFKSHGIEVVKEFDDDCQALINASEIRQVLLNLFTNAVDALTDVDRQDRRITIHIESDDDVATISVADNGSGIDPESQTEIFDLLHTNKSHGTGLGLWLCRALLDRNKGSIEFRPAAGGGAEFLIRLPRVKD